MGREGRAELLEALASELWAPSSRTGCWRAAAVLEQLRAASSRPACPLGVSTRRMDKVVESLGVTRLSKSPVSRTAADLDEQVAAFRTRPLDAGPYTFVAADALR